MLEERWMKICLCEELTLLVISFSPKVVSKRTSHGQARYCSGFPQPSSSRQSGDEDDTKSSGLILLTEEEETKRDINNTINDEILFRRRSSSDVFEF